MRWYLRHLMSMEDFCEEFKHVVIDTEFTDLKTNKITSKPSIELYCWTPRYQEHWQILNDIVDLCDIFGIEYLEERKPMMVQRVKILNTPESIPIRSNFEFHLDYIKNVFKGVEKEVRNKLQLLDEEEEIRLNEALNCYIQGCKYSAVAMSVSAIEFRLLNLMQSVKPNPDLEKCTLGELVNEYLQNKKEYKNVIPKKYEPLLSLCNTYRIFSVHPKREKITKPITTSIVNMTFAFLLDEKIKHKAEMK